MKILIPLLSKKENNAEFLNKALKGVKEVILLLVVNAEAIPGIGFVASEIGQGQKLMEEIKTEIGKRRKTCDDIMEWGNTMNKIEHIAQLQEIEKIVVVRQDNQFYKNLVKELKEKGFEVEAIKISEAPT